MEDAKVELDRRDFMGLAAAMAAIGVGAALPVTTATAAQGTATDFTRWLDSIPGNQKVLFDMREPNGRDAFSLRPGLVLSPPPRLHPPPTPPSAPPRR